MRITPQRARELVREAFPDSTTDDVDSPQSWAHSLARTLCRWEDDERAHAVALCYGALITGPTYAAGHGTTLMRAEACADALLARYRLVARLPAPEARAGMF